MSDTSVADASRPSRRLLLSALGAWTVLAVLLPLAASALNVVTIGGFKLGFWIVAQGALIGLAALAYAFARRAGGSPSGDGPLPAATAAGEATGAAVVIGFSSAIASLGFGGLALPLGVIAGLSLMAIAIAPRFVLYPVRSIGGYFTLRFGGAWPRRVALAIAGASAVLLLAANLRAGALALQAVFAIDYAQAAGAMTLAVAAVWIAASLVRAQSRRGLVYLALLAASFAAVAALAMRYGRTPADVVAYGGALIDLAAIEQKLVAGNLSTFETLRPMTSPFLQLSMINFVGIVLALAFGVAVLPHLLGRHASHAAVSTGGAARRIAHATLFAAILVIGLAAYAAHARIAVAGFVASGVEAAAPPAALIAAQKIGWVEVCGAKRGADIAAVCAQTPDHRGFIRMQDLAIADDAQAVAAPLLAGIDPTFISAIFAALAAAAVAVSAAILTGWLDADGEARSSGGVDTGALDLRTIALGATIASAAAVIAIVGEVSAANLFVDGLAIIAAGLFPAIALSLYWRRMTAGGAVAAMLAGFSLAALYIAGVRVFPLQMFAWTGGLSDAGPSAIEAFAALQSELAGPLTSEAREIALDKLNSTATIIANWGGLTAPAIVLYAAPLAVLAAVLGSLVSRPPAYANDEGSP
jgi:cation/acetate symporter